MKLFDYWDWEDTVGLFVLMVAAAFISLAIIALTADHRIRAYYLNQRGNTPCVFADEDWDQDSVAYCSDDPARLIDMLDKLNRSLRETHK